MSSVRPGSDENNGSYKERLDEPYMGHYVEEVKSGSETLLKIDNAYYRIFPTVKRAYKVPIQGANLVPVYQM